jgi:hypothetical protein
MIKMSYIVYTEHKKVKELDIITYPSLSGICAFIAVTLASFHLGDQNGERGVLPLFIPEKSIPLGNIVISVIYS